MATLEHRIEILEAQLQAQAREHLALFRCIHGAETAGWRYCDLGGSESHAMRLPDETDDELMERAARAARVARPGNPVVLRQIRCLGGLTPVPGSESEGTA